MRKCDDIRGRLTLYLDNELQGDERVTVETHLSACETCAAIFARELHFLDAVRNSGVQHEASPQLRNKVRRILGEGRRAPAVSEKQSTIRPRRFGWVIAIATGLLALLLPVLVWYFVRQTDPAASRPSSFALMAADTHMRHMRGQLPLEMESGDPQQVSWWFANKVKFSVQLPNYQESSGQEKLYTLEGARLLCCQNDYAYVAYRMKGRPITLIITSGSVAQPSGGEQISSRGLRFHYNAIDGLKVITWSDRGLTYALVSDLEDHEQNPCIVCHEGTKDQDFIEPLKPH
jgi:anti-sigma factor RsiW